MQAQSLGWEDPPEREMATTAVFSAENSHGQRSLVGCRLCGRTESGTAEAT